MTAGTGTRAQDSLSGCILTPGGWIDGHIVVDGKRVVRIEGTPVSLTAVPHSPYILPGFIDLHVHGGDGVNYADGEAGIRRFIRFHAASGTVAIAPTTSTAPVEVIDRALSDIERVRNRPGPNEATVLGAHLEGPFINRKKLGAQADRTLEGDPELALRWTGICPLLVATVAPEIPGGIAVIEALAARGCRVQVGHSIATAEEAAEGFRRGLVGFTHLFNGMSGFDHRQPGVAAYALSQGQYAELICDFIHVHPAVALAAYRAIPRLYAITDASTLAGCPDGEHGEGTDHHVVKKGKTIMLASGKSLAGSAITMLDAFRNLISLGLTIAQASQLCSTRQADYVGRSELGRIAPGALASFVTIDQRLVLDSVWIEGKPVQAAAEAVAV
jgi:N-acetylglucosamine-6-phosphate deacetylase